MRACAAANAVVVGLLGVGAVVAACSGGSDLPPPQPPPAVPEATAPVDMGVPAPTPAAATPKIQPLSVADCRQVAAVITNEPPSNGVVMNNAMTSADAGSSDRLGAMIDVVKARRDAFRCCFDLWSKQNPGKDGKVVVVWSLKPDGALDKVEVDQAKSSLHAPQIDACITDVAQSIKYPVSPSKKNTTFTYPFDFKAR